MFKALKRVQFTGVTQATPSHLVDKVIYSNWVSIIGIILVFVALPANVTAGRWIMVYSNLAIFAVLAACLLLNATHSYKASRLVLMWGLFVLGTWMCAIQGKIMMMHNLYFAYAVIAFCVFHPGERKNIVLFAVLCGIAFVYFDSHEEPIFNIDPMAKAYSSVDYILNQLIILALFFGALWKFLTSYESALQLADVRRAQAFERNRFNSLVRFAGGVAHEINNPLTILYGRAAHIRQQIEAERISLDEVKRSIGVIENTARRIAEVVKSLAIFAREGRGEKFKVTEINDFVSRATKVVSDNLLGKNIKLNVDLAPRILVAEIQEVNLWQVLMNILINAIDASRESAHPEIWVSTDLVDNHIEIRVRDSGPGVPKELEDKIFSPFFTTKTVGQGAGLGLSVARSVVQEHRGDLRLDRRICHSCFVISLPAAPKIPTQADHFNA